MPPQCWKPSCLECLSHAEIWGCLLSHKEDTATILSLTGDILPNLSLPGLHSSNKTPEIGFKERMDWVECCRPGVPALGKPQLEDPELKASLIQTMGPYLPLSYTQKSFLWLMASGLWSVVGWPYCFGLRARQSTWQRLTAKRKGKARG